MARLEIARSKHRIVVGGRTTHLDDWIIDAIQELLDEIEDLQPSNNTLPVYDDDRSVLGAFTPTPRWYESTSAVASEQRAYRVGGVVRDGRVVALEFRSPSVSANPPSPPDDLAPYFESSLDHPRVGNRPVYIGDVLFTLDGEAIIVDGLEWSDSLGWLALGRTRPSVRLSQCRRQGVDES